MPSPELLALNATLREQTAATPLDLSWEEQRAGYETLGDLYPADAAAARTTLSLGGIPAVRFAGADADARRAVLYFHGGGYCVGGIVTHHAITSRIALAAGCPVYALDYRLAPEHPFPAPVEDAVAAYHALLEEGLRPEHIVFAGDSAGGGLTVAAMLAAREAGLPMPAAGVPISPWVDLTGELGWRDMDGAVDPMVRHADLDSLTRAYMAGGDSRHPHAAPVHGDLSGLPPLLIQVGTAEILLPDARVLAQRASAAGVEVFLEEEEGAPHVWHHFVATIPEAVTAIARIGAFVRERTT
jgi:epsilon-lactone hydrolase